MTTACPTLDDWRGLLAETVSPEQRDRMAAHLDACPRCQAALEQAAGSLQIPQHFGPTAVTPPHRNGHRQEHGNGDALRSVISRLLAAGAASAEESPLKDISLPPGVLSPSTVPGSLGRMGKYEVLSVIGRGGLGVVLRGLDPQLNRIVAIKIPAPEFAANPTVRRRFLREAQAAAAVSHDHVVTIHAVDEAQGTPYLVMEYISGISLQQEIDQHGPLDTRKTLRIAMQTASGLAAAHKQGLVHRDVKPANILLENGVQRVKLTDFGLARAVDDASITQSGVVAGTPQYMSPEQARGDSIDTRSDLFSLGAVMYAMATGRAAFRADSTLAVLRRVCEDQPRPIPQINPDVPAWLTDIIDRLLAKNPRDRIQTAQDVVELLSERLAYAQEPATTAAPRKLPPPPVVRRKRLWRIERIATALAITSLLIALLLGFFWTTEVRYEATPVADAVGASSDVEVVDLSISSRKAPSDPPTRPVAPVPPRGDGWSAILPSNPSTFHFNTDVYSARFLPDGQQILVGTWGSGLQVIDGPSGGYSQSTFSMYPFITRAIPLAEGRIAATGDAGRFEVFTPGQPVGQTFRLGTKMIWQLSAAADGRQVAAGGDDGIVSVWHIDQGLIRTFHHRRQAIDSPAERAEPEASSSSESPAGAGSKPIIVRCVAISPDGAHVVSGGTDGVVRAWNIKANRQVMEIQPVEASDLAFFGDSRRVAIAGNDYKVHVWDITTGEDRKITGHTDVIVSIAVSRDQRTIASGSDDRSIRIWNAETGRSLLKIHGHTGKITSLDFSPDGRWLAASGLDRTVRVWKMPDVDAAASAGDVEEDARPPVDEILPADAANSNPPESAIPMDSSTVADPDGETAAPPAGPPTGPPPTEPPAGSAPSTPDAPPESTSPPAPPAPERG
ncbi:MAG: protein kinase [Planctomyces sp.]|nr:protein kinase [Planctomyces sp.]